MKSARKGTAGDHLQEGLPNSGPRAEPSLLPVSIDKVLLEHSHAHPSMHRLRLRSRGCSSGVQDLGLAG